VPNRVVVDAGGVDPADRAHATVQGLLDQFRRSGTGQNAALREGDLLDGDPVGEPVRHGGDGGDPVQPHLGVDVGMGTHVRRARGDHALQQRRHPVHVGQAELATAASLVGDPIGQCIPGGVRDPRSAVQRLVQMAVRIDEPGKHETPGDVDDLAARPVG
jgi:hypothetical protein